MGNAVAEAFDRHAPAYERAFPSAGIRKRVWDLADSHFPPGSSVLDLGCGPGDDAAHFAMRGVKVTAVDISPVMISRLESRPSERVRFCVADMTTYRHETAVDGVISNFGALNCVPDLDWLLRLPVSPGGYLVLTLMGRFYPLEFAISALKGRPRQAFRRLRRRGQAVVEGVQIPVYYHSIREMRQRLGRQFDLTEIRGICSLEPAPHLEHLRRYKVVRGLSAFDAWLCSCPWTAPLSDHYITVWRRRET